MSVESSAEENKAGSEHRPGHLATVVIGGSDDEPRCFMGGQNNIELRTTVSLDGIHASWEYMQHQPTPWNLLRYIARKEGPRVLLPDGRVLKSSDKAGHESDFCDPVAKMFAEQNGGIYFKSGFPRDKYDKIDFSTFMRAMRICIQNMAISDADCIRRLYEKEAQKPDALSALEKEGEHLDSVTVLVAEDIISRERGSDGIVGSLHQGEGDDRTSYFGPQENQYKARLGLEMDGFGWYHFQITGRSLAAEFRGVGFEEQSSEARVIKNFVSASFDCPRDNYELDIEWKKYKHSDGVESMTLLMRSTGTLFTSNAKLEHPVMQTDEMLPIFFKAADRVAVAISKAEQYRNQQAKERYAALQSAMGLAE